MSNAEYTATGRRKTAVAAVRMQPGTGRIRVNGKAVEEYFPSPSLQFLISQPLEVTKQAAAFDVRVKTRGGGLAGQAGAIRLGIARALLQANENHRPVLREHGLLTRDPRMKERKKPGQPGARKRFQFSKR